MDSPDTRLSIFIYNRATLKSKDINAAETKLGKCVFFQDISLLKSIQPP